MKAEKLITFSVFKSPIEKAFSALIKTKRYGKKLDEVKKRAIEALSMPTILIAGLLVKTLLSFTSWIRAILITWGVLDGFVSNYIYREEKFFPYQFLRYARIVANFSGIVNPYIPVIWNIGDGIYSMMIYKRSASSIEVLPRLGRVVNGTLQAIL